MVFSNSFKYIPYNARGDHSKLLLWSEKINEHGQPELWAAPLKHASEKESVIYNYIKHEENKQNQQELQRLLYVAATRAKEELHFICPPVTKINKKSLFYLLRDIHV